MKNFRLAGAVALAAGGLVGGLRRVLELVAGVRGLGGLRRFRRQLLGQFQQGIGFKCFAQLHFQLHAGELQQADGLLQLRSQRQLLVQPEVERRLHSHPLGATILIRIGAWVNRPKCAIVGALHMPSRAR